MSVPELSLQFVWVPLQPGRLPLLPNGTMTHIEGRCTVVLLWPAGEDPMRANTLIVDPGLTAAGLKEADRMLKLLGLSLGEIGYQFVTHPHPDHRPEGLAGGLNAALWEPERVERLAGVQSVSVPGHHPDQQALVFKDPTAGRVWVVGDAILDEVWLRAWQYYWPNGYTAEEVAETWRSVSTILADADLILPGHGPAIHVTASLIQDLLAAFPSAPHANLCPAVADTLQERLAQLQVR